MVKKLTKHGNSLALVIDRPILDLLGIDADTPLSVTTDGKRLHIGPERDAAEAAQQEDASQNGAGRDPERDAKFRAALEKVNRLYGPALQRLAE